ncbi:hypothetical protein V2J09_011783 [Rumex salicifolius]
MAAAVSTTPNLKTPSSQGRSWKNPIRRPLLPSETGNNVVAQRRPKATTREVTSRYMSTSSSSSSTSSSSASNSSYPSTRRSASPSASRILLSGSATPPVTPSSRSSLNKRSQSADRRRPATPRPIEGAIGAEISTAAKMLMSSKRSLSISFQGDSFLTPLSKTKSTPQSNSVKSTPERRTVAGTTPRVRGDQRENSRPAERNPWPSSSRQVSSVKQSLNKSVDLANDRKKLMGRSGKGIRASRQSLDELVDYIPCHNKLQDKLSSTPLTNGAKNAESANLLTSFISASESAASDTESVCSGSNSSSKDNGIVPHNRAGSRGIFVPARVWQETNNRLKSSSLCRSNSLKATSSPYPREKLISRGLSPLRGGGLRSASPSRLVTSTLPLEKNFSSRVMASPSRVRNAIAGTSGNTTCSEPSVLCFAADVRRGKSGDSKIRDAHLLRLMYNRHLQWRFANSRAEAALSLQKHIAETNLYNAWKATSDLRLSVSNRRMELSRMSLKLKLLSILKEQIIYLEEWAVIEKDHSNSLKGATESLRASTLRLPIVCGAMADTQNLKDTMCTAYDVLQAMTSSICSLMSKMEQMNSLLDGVVSTATSERVMLDECKGVLSALAAIQVKDCSLRAQNLQQKQVATSFPIET